MPDARAARPRNKSSSVSFTGETQRNFAPGARVDVPLFFKPRSAHVSDYLRRHEPMTV